MSFWDGADQPSTVLIADDDELLAKSLGYNVRQLGLEVIGPAFDGKQAIELARETRPDLAIMDIRMPMVSGLSAATVMFKQMGIPVVIVSAYSDAEYLEAGKRVGVFGYLLKPITADQLRVGIGVAWARYIQQESLRHKVHDLRSALEDRNFVERAKKLLMDKIGLDEAEAMLRLRKEARDSRRRLPDLARALIETEERFKRHPNPE